MAPADRAACLAAVLAVAGRGHARIGRTAGPGRVEDQRDRVQRPSGADFVELINTGRRGRYRRLRRQGQRRHARLHDRGRHHDRGRRLLRRGDRRRPGGFGLGSADSARLFARAAPRCSTATAGPRTRRRPTAAARTAAAPSRPPRPRRRARRTDCGAAAPDVKINEVESSGGAPADFVELINNGAAPADIGGYVIRDNDDTHTFTIPAGTTIAAGGYYVVDIDTGPAASAWARADSARLFAPGGTTLVDSYDWTAHAATTYGRCPNGTGAFTTTTASTKGAANVCPGDVVALAVAGRRRHRDRRRRQRVRRATSAGSPTSRPAPTRPACCGRCATARARSTASSTTARSGRRTRPTAGAPASSCATPTAPAIRTPRA